MSDNCCIKWIRNPFCRTINMNITIVGLQGAGKTSLVNVISGNDYVENMIPTQGFNTRNITKDKIKIKMLDVGGQARFRSLWEQYCTGAHVIIFVVDSSNANRFVTASSELVQILACPSLNGIPVLVLGNKKDLPNALNEKQLIDEMNLSAIKDREVCCYSVSCKTMENIDITLDWLIQHTAIGN